MLHASGSMAHALPQQDSELCRCCRRSSGLGLPLLGRLPDSDSCTLLSAEGKYGPPYLVLISHACMSVAVFAPCLFRTSSRWTLGGTQAIASVTVGEFVCGWFHACAGTA